jgi:ABC-type thiamine transport system substrate-binding protein
MRGGAISAYRMGPFLNSEISSVFKFEESARTALQFVGLTGSRSLLNRTERPEEGYQADEN